MTKYEILLLLDPGLDDDRQGEIVGRVRELVEKGEGTWDLHDVWGRRRLAFEIDHKAEGSYHLLHFTSGAATLEEISRVLRIDDGVMRHLATRRIEGSPVRPVAVAAPARQDSQANVSTGDSAPAGSENGASGADDSGVVVPEAAPETSPEDEEED
ncbi:MAG: 30S ribosomal protein S6 [Actinobacteria bacterium]|nr:30S ribosomal protein S6 [Actinomycetota bacterium]